MTGWIKEFKEFAVRGNVMDMAVGVIIGAAFGKIVTSLVNDVIMPPIGLLAGGMDFSNLFINLSATPAATLAEAKAASLPVIHRLRLVHQHRNQLSDTGVGHFPRRQVREQAAQASPRSAEARAAPLPLLLLRSKRKSDEMPALHL